MKVEAYQITFTVQLQLTHTAVKSLKHKQNLKKPLSNHCHFVALISFGHERAKNQASVQ